MLPLSSCILPCMRTENWKCWVRDSWILSGRRVERVEIVLRVDSVPWFQSWGNWNGEILRWPAQGHASGSWLNEDHGEGLCISWLLPSLLPCHPSVSTGSSHPSHLTHLFLIIFISAVLVFLEFFTSPSHLEHFSFLPLLNHTHDRAPIILQIMYSVQTLETRGTLCPSTYCFHIATGHSYPWNVIDFCDCLAHSSLTFTVQPSCKVVSSIPSFLALNSALLVPVYPSYSLT